MIVAKLPQPTVAAFNVWMRAQPPHGANWSWPVHDHDHRGRVEATAANLARAARLSTEAGAAYDRSSNATLRAAMFHWQEWAEYFHAIAIELGTMHMQEARDAAVAEA